MIRSHKEGKSSHMTYQEVKNVGKDKSGNGKINRLFINVVINSRGNHKAKCVDSDASGSEKWRCGEGQGKYLF